MLRLSNVSKSFTEDGMRVDALKDVVPAVKVQVAYYEMYGVAGMRAFKDTLAYARENGLIAIADIKRNDIGSTAAAYSRAYIGATELAGGVKVTPFESDFVTVNGYLGSDGVKPFVADCENQRRRVRHDAGGRLRYGGALALVRGEPAQGNARGRALLRRLRRAREREDPDSNVGPRR